MQDLLWEQVKVTPDRHILQVYQVRDVCVCVVFKPYVQSTCPPTVLQVAVESGRHCSLARKKAHTSKTPPSLPSIGSNDGP